MRYINRKISGISLVIGMALCGGAAAEAAPADMFPAESPLSKGKWVKIEIAESGLYQITYDELRAMGFSDPSKVAVYGRGGLLQPVQFVPSDGSEGYTSQMQPVALMRYGDKILFYGQDPSQVRYYSEMHNRVDGQRFQRKSINVFASNASYFLSDSGPGEKLVQTVESGNCDTRLPEYTRVWDYFYHEKDMRTYASSGREFFGEDFREESTHSFPYSIPGAIPGESASLTCRFVASSPNESQITYGLSAGSESVSGSEKIASLPDMRYYTSNESAKGYQTLALPASEGTMDVSFSGSGVSFAALDYLLLGARRDLRFEPGESLIRAFVYDYTPQKFGYVRLDNVPDELVVWDVTDSRDVKALPFRKDEGSAKVRYLTRYKKDGMMLAFDPRADHRHIRSYSDVPNQNLHSLGLDKMPGMLIITLPELKPAADRLAALHREVDGMEVAVALSDEVVNEFSDGVPDPMAYRAIAKMLYDRDDADNRVFRNLLLLGPSIRDNRNVLGIVPATGTLIANESYLSRDGDNTYCLNDWYGMLADCTEYGPESLNLYRVPMDIGVGLLPCNSLAQADNYVDKVAAAYADDTYAQWLGEYIYSADGTNNNEHQNWCELLWQSSRDASQNALTGSKLYNNLYDAGGTKREFIRRMKEGAFLSTYVGHASSIGLNSEFWRIGDENSLTNRRLGFMNFAACSVSPFDSNDLGTGCAMLFEPNHGIVGTILTSRSGYSSQNYEFMNVVQRSFLLDHPSSDALLSAPRTVGEVYAMAKSNLNISNNEMAYHLICDPALTLPFPTAGVDVRLDNADGLYPGTRAALTGSVHDRQGNLLKGFNGNVAVKIYSAPVKRKTSTRNGSPSVELTLDENLVSAGEFEVTDGKFSGEIFIPISMSSTGEDEHASIRLSAYDPSTRTGATGVVPAVVNQIDESKVSGDHTAPVITSMYVDTPGMDDNMPVGSSFTLYAEIEDDEGIMLYGHNGLPSFYVLIDGKRDGGSLTDAIRISDGGRKLRLILPVDGLAEGRHTLTLFVADGMENSSSRSMQVNVSSRPQTGRMQASSGRPARNNVTITLTDTSDEYTAVADILDHNGNLVFSAPMGSSDYVWDLKDSGGKRVRSGIYYAVARLYLDGIAAGVSSPAEIIVF